MRGYSERPAGRVGAAEAREGRNGRAHVGHADDARGGDREAAPADDLSVSETPDYVRRGMVEVFEAFRAGRVKSKEFSRAAYGGFCILKAVEDTPAGEAISGDPRKPR